VTTDLVDVRLLDLPLELLNRPQQHGDELTREFSHIASPATDSDRVPERLLALSAQLRRQYGAYTGPVAEQVAAANERGDATIDVTYRVPRSAEAAAVQLGAMYDEVDEYCRSGELLTLATPPDLVEFRRWFFGQFITQMNGAQPVPWSQG
jgi:hypothetical protein